MKQYGLHNAIIVLLLLTVCGPSAMADDAHPVHLILLSGQSNMANLDPTRVLIPELENHFGAKNVIVVKAAQKGQPIRRWFKQWKVTGDQNPAEIGDLHGQLMAAARTALNGRATKSVTLIWMQGERDAKERLADHYEEAFLGIVEQIKADLGVSDINCIIGRLSDSGVGKKDWDRIRDVQTQLGESGPRRAWIDTDDLNDDNTTRDGTALKENDLHYSEQGYDFLAKRYAEKVKVMLSHGN